MGGMTVEKRNLGNTDLAITALGYGAMELRHVGEGEATRLLNAALDGGINYVDTSPDYGPSETYVGKAISHRRDEFYLATKCGCNIDSNGRPKDPPHIWTREKLLENVENSLRLLKTDHIDVWQLHGAILEWLAGGKTDEAVETMLELKRQGKVRTIGISFRNGRPGDERYPAGYGFECIREFMSWDVFDVMQIVYGGLTRKNELAIAKAAARGFGMIARGVVKRYRDDYDELFEEARLDELYEENESRNSFLIRFALSHPGISTMIIGTRNPDHIAGNIQAATRGKLPDDVYEEAKRRLDAAGVVAEEL